MVLAPHASGTSLVDVVFAVAGRARAARRAGTRICDASIGIMIRDDGSFWVPDTPLRALNDLGFERHSRYSPFLGTPEFRRAVSGFLPTPQGLHHTVIGTPGATGAVHLAFETCLEVHQKVLVHEPGWSNYLTIAQSHGRGVEWYPFVGDDGRFDLAAVAARSHQLLRRQGRLLVVVNAPAHNPTGSSLEPDEWRDLARLMRDLSESGLPVILLVDAAYLEFTPDPDADRLFARHFADLPGNFLLLAAWSGSKAYATYGMRLGALVAWCSSRNVIRDLEGAANVINRGTWGHAPKPGMEMVVHIEQDPALRAAMRDERQEMCAAIARREALFSSAAKLDRFPYHAGFFTVVHHDDPEQAAAELEAHHAYVVPLQNGLRVSLSGLRLSHAKRLAELMAEV